MRHCSCHPDALTPASPRRGQDATSTDLAQGPSEVYLPQTLARKSPHREGMGLAVCLPRPTSRRRPSCGPHPAPSRGPQCHPKPSRWRSSVPARRSIAAPLLVGMPSPSTCGNAAPAQAPRSGHDYDRAPHPAAGRAECRVAWTLAAVDLCPGLSAYGGRISGAASSVSAATTHERGRSVPATSTVVLTPSRRG